MEMSIHFQSKIIKNIKNFRKELAQDFKNISTPRNTRNDQ